VARVVIWAGPRLRNCCSVATVTMYVAISRTPETISKPAQGRFGALRQAGKSAEAYAGLDRLLIIPSLDAGKARAQNVAAIDAAGRRASSISSSCRPPARAMPRGRCSEPPYWWGEQRLIATAPAWTILRMNFYAESFAQQAQMSLAQGVLGRAGREPCCFRRAR